MSLDRTDLLAQVAIWYYEEGLDQETIARRIGRSRSLVSRLLDQARQAGLVEVRVRYPLRTDAERESRLVEAFGLKTALVLARPPGAYNELLRLLGELGARYLHECLAPGARVGVGWGTGVHGVVQAMPDEPLPGASVVQMIGAIGRGDPMVDGTELARWLARKLGAACFYISAPLIVENEGLANALLREPTIAEAVRKASAVDVALLGIGSLAPEYSSLLRAGYVSADELTGLVSAGAVGDVLARHLDSQGRVLDVDLNRRVVGIPDLAMLRHIPKVIAVAGGIPKAPAILAALRGGYFNVLVTDSVTADALLSSDVPAPSLLPAS